MNMRRRAARLALITTGLLLGVSAIAYATIPSSGGVISGCYEKRTGLLRVIDTQAGARCMSFELPISWNQQGPKGDPGAAGAAGAEGPQGDRGRKASGVPKASRVRPALSHSRRSRIRRAHAGMVRQERSASRSRTAATSAGNRPTSSTALPFSARR